MVGTGVDLGHTGVVFISDSVESRTRERVRHAVSEHGPVTASRIAGDLGLTAAAVRRHLDALSAEGAITERDGPAAVGGRGRGRPARAFVLSEAGHARLENQYDGVATAALHFLADQAGEEAVEEFARQRVAEFEERYADLLDAAGDDIEARTRALAEALSAEGYAASARPVGRGSPFAGVQLCQGHCPLQHVATEFRQFCDAETDAFSRLLRVHVQRLATLAGGEHVCTTFVPTASLSRPPTPDTAAHPTTHRTTADERSS